MNSLAPDSVLKNRNPDPTHSAPAAQLLADFEVAALEHRPYLMQIAVASARNPSDAEDVVQEALVRGFRGLSGFRGDCPLRTWLARIVVRVSINQRLSFMRRVKRWSLFCDLERKNSEGRTDPFDAPDRSDQIDREAMMDVERHVQNLPEEFKIPLLMRAVDGMTISEIAAVLDIPEGTVKSRIYYGRRRLKKKLKL